MKTRKNFNCGEKMEKIMEQQNWNQGFVADLLGVTRQNISQKLNKNDMKVSEVERIMWAMDKDLYEFFVSAEEVAKIYNISPELAEVCIEINKRPAESQKALLTLMKNAIVLDKSGPADSAVSAS